MTPDTDNTVEYNSLSWVKAQLDDVVADTQSNLNDYIEDKDKVHLENCIEHLQLIYGTLQMVEVYGGAMLAEEMQLTTSALLEGEVEREEDTYDVLMRAILQLPDYLESIQAGGADAPIKLMPLINDLRAARKEGLLTESVLFSPEIDTAILDSVVTDTSTIEPGQLSAEAKRLRTHYQLGLLDFIRNNKVSAGLQRIKAVLAALEKVSADSQVRNLWIVFSALVESLLKEGIETSLSIKMMMGALDRQIKLLLDEGEEAFAANYSRELVKNALYYVGISTVSTPRIDNVKAAYRLEELLPKESDDASAIGGLNADLFDTVSAGITEDLGQVKDVLELYIHSQDQDVQQLVPVVDQLARLADTFGMLGMGAARQSILEQRSALDAVVSSGAELTDQMVLQIASELLGAESDLKNYIAERTGFVDMNRRTEDSTVPAAEYQQVLFTVVSEGLKNFGEAKEAILSYVSSIGDKEQLDIILKRLEEVRGVAMMLPLGRVKKLITKLEDYIRVALKANDHKVNEAEQDIVADVVTAIEYFFEALAEGRPGVEQGLSAGEAAVEKLVQITEAYGGADSQVQQAEIPETVVSEVPEPDVDEVPETEELAVDEAEPASVKTNEAAGQDESAAVDHAAHEYAILSDEADEEILEIFIEEAIEVLGELHEHLPRWRDNANDEESLAVVRRSFHTLKGSGRLLGAELIGEFSWKFENMLNKVIDKKIEVSDVLLQALDEAVAVLPQLIEQLKGNREPVDNIAQLMATADDIADGKQVSLDFATEVPEFEQQETEQQETEQVQFEQPVIEDITDDIIELDVAADQPEALDEGEDVIEIVNSDDEFSIELEPDSETAVSMEDFEVESISDEQTPESAIEITDFAPDDESEGDDQGLMQTPFYTTGDPEAHEEISISEQETGFDSANEFGFVSDDESIEFSVQEEPVVESQHIEQIPADESGMDYDSGEPLDIDEMLLTIYHDESQGHINDVREIIRACDESGQPILADKNMMRAFHTLFGSARTAEIMAIADLCGAFEKYIKARQDTENEMFSPEASMLVREAEQAITRMLEVVAKGNKPLEDADLLQRVEQMVASETQPGFASETADNVFEIEPEQSPPQAEEISVEAFDATEDVSTSEAFDVELDDLSPSSDDESIEISDDEVAVDEQSVQTPVAESSAAEESEFSYGDIDDELIDIFLEEAEELLESCEVTLNEIMSDPSPENIHQLQRNMHTLKGGARMADLKPVGDLTHNLESLVVLVSENKVEQSKTLFDLLHESVDTLTNLINQVKQRQQLEPVAELNRRIEMLMRGETDEKRSVERFDIDLSELEQGDDDDLESLQPTDAAANEITAGDNQPVAEAEVVSEAEAAALRRRADDSDEDRPHWGERATDVAFKESHEQIRVRSDLLNNLVNYAGEVNIYHARMSKQISDFAFNLNELTQTVIRLKEQLRNLEIETEIQIRSGYEKESEAYDDAFDPLEMDQYSTLQQLTRSLSETAGDVQSINEILADITRDSETLLMQEARISTDLQEGLMRTRMVRFGGLGSRLRRIVRQVARELGKEVELVIEGETTEVDRTVLDRIIAPLEHMLRNAVAHGIETPEARRILGKDDAGRITISVNRQAGDILIKVRDDGAGIDVNKVRQKAIALGYITEDANYSDHDVLQFILQSGFSTADNVSQVAGRGVGMDVVESEIKQLGGVLDIDTDRGQGTIFNIRLPLTLAINQALLVSAGDEIYAVPLNSIEGVVRMTGLELQRFYDSGNTQYDFNGIEYELKHLGWLLSGQQPDYSKQLRLFPVLLIHVGDQHFALHVDDLVGRREIVVKPVGLQIGSVRGIAGATILADGRVVMILEMSALVVGDNLFRPHEQEAIDVEAEQAKVTDTGKKTVMVVDDSITIRKVTERMLTRYGIDVILAKDGVDATNQLQDHIPDLMLLDIEMPRMDGFEVASYVRNDERLKDIPIIMITSRTGSKHRDKAMEIGVNEYLGKPYQEDELVRNINEILNTSF